MTAAVITGVSHHHEQQLVAMLESADGVEVVRRCADVAELLSTGASGVADVAVVSADFRGLDRDGLRHLAGHGVRVAGLVASGDEASEARLRQLGVRTMVRPGDDPQTLAAAIVDLSGGRAGAAPTAATGARDASLTDDDLARWLAGPSAAASAASIGLEPIRDDDGPPRALVTAVWGPTGAPGRTTVAVTLASHLASRGVRTLLVDLDTWGASVAQLLALVDEAPGVAAAARASEQGTLDLAALSRVAPEVTPGLRVLTGIPTPHRWPELRAAAVEDVLEQARNLVDHVVVDCGFSIEDDEELSYDTAAPRRNATTLTVLEQCDTLVAVGAADPIGLQRLVRAVQDVAVIPSPAPVVVVNKVRASATGSRPEHALADVLSRFVGLEDPVFVPWAPDDCDAALLAGRSLVEHAPSAPVTRAIARLAAVVRPDLVAVAPTGSRSRRGRLRRGSHRSG
ncbi:AAA family ATPase [Knoellia sp. CPCC 206435]|uniref:AAA family ATPase n=1 Tax=Knoellia terrae TaxID=3404797 RepID=UPI003B42CE36